ncbi:MAG: sensor histidine kinase [Chthoniobacter sp.]|nr:sensor histidine kinase [Chthoniobacter sp.]
MTRLISALERQPRVIIVVAALLTVVLVGVIDYLTGYEISLSIFYLAAIAPATWFVGRRTGALVSVFSVFCWLASDLAAGATYANRLIPIWNVSIGLVLYLVIVVVLSNLRTLQDQLETKVIERTAALSAEMTKREELEKELLAVGERERRRIGQDLHDSVCQHLTGTALAGQVLSEKLAAKALPEEGHARQVVALIEEGMVLTRNLARGLAPVELEAEGLMAALRELARATTERFKIDCRFDAPHPVLIRDAATSTQLFRIAQEAVNNAMKHAHASRVSIELSLEGDDLCLAVRDDGRGFQAPSPADRGMGLHIMRHRASMIGATLMIQKQTPGTVVTCRLRSEDDEEEA